ncbi:ras guanine nucleotide exchange factor domain-containing protein [Chlamydoabsidia padenii]|nr:ras guanine nucleotide exchange factor domain-containing protein [Chlamydoabsidia padenii]
MEMTEDGTDCYFYNKLTGEMRTSPPVSTISMSNSNSNHDESIEGFNDSGNDSDGISDGDSEFSTLDNNKGDNNHFGFQSVGGKLDENMIIGYDDAESDMLPPNWVKRTNHQGRVYYCNLQTQDTTWDVKSIDPITGNLLSPSKNIDQLSVISQHSISTHSSNNSINNHRGKVDVNRPLTWNMLSSHIAVAINKLTQAGKNQEKSLYIECAGGIIDSIRLMLLASGTIDKDSDIIRSNAILRSHHRTMMAAMSKVMLTSFLTADGDGDDVNKLLDENTELLVAVRNFVGICQDLIVPVEHVDPKLVPDEGQEENKQLNHQRKSEQTKYALQHDLADNLDVYGTNMHESVDAILIAVRNQQLDKDALMTESSRLQFSTNMFTQFRNLSSQTGQFLGLVDDIDFGAVEDSPFMMDLLHNKQALSDGLGRLFCHLQQLTNQDMSPGNVLLDVQHSAEGIHIPMRNICECINIMVYDLEMSTRSSLDSIKHIAKPTVINDHHHHHHKGSIDDIQYNKNHNTTNSNGDNNDDDDHATFMGDSIFSGGNLTYNDTEITVPSTANSSSINGDKYLDQHSSSITTTLPEKPISSADSQTTRKPSIQKTSTTTTTAVDKSPQRQGSVKTSSSTQDADLNKSSHKLKKFFGDDVPSPDIVTTKPTSSDRPSYLSYDYDLSDISFNMEGNVKGGTLPALVERLTLHDYLDMNFNNTFLLTYRSFCTSTELLDLLEARYNLIPPSDISNEDMEIWRQKKLKLVRLRVFNVLKNWLEVYYNEEDQIILNRLMTFTDTTIRSTLSFSTDQLERLIQKRKEGTEMDVGGLKKLVWTPQSIPQSILPRNPKKFKLLDIEPIELARQLTIMDFKMYSSIRPIECLDKAWSRETPDDVAPTAINIRASIEYCNQVTSWVSDAILSQNDIKKRSNLIKFWVQVAEKCRELNNFNTCMAILSAFDNSSVGRLKRTWEMVGARTNQILSHIRKIMGANRNFSEYRQLIHSVNPPCIPFLGIYLQDLTFIEDGNSNVIKKSKDLINFAKREKTAEVIREIQQYQTLFYKLKAVDEMQSFIKDNLRSTRDEDQLYKESLKLEPREREDEKITRLLQESGFL